MRPGFRSKGLSLEKIIDAVAGNFQIKKDEIKSRDLKSQVDDVLYLL